MCDYQPVAQLLENRLDSSGLRWAWLESAEQESAGACKYPYSQELNPVESVWDYLRQSRLCSTVWDRYDVIVRYLQNSLELVDHRSRTSRLNRQPPRNPT